LSSGVWVSFGLVPKKQKTVARVFVCWWSGVWVQNHKNRCLYRGLAVLNQNDTTLPIKFLVATVQETAEI
jgi:hypothetical protein